MRDNKEELSLNRINECGMLIDRFLELYDALRQRDFSKAKALETAKDVINCFMLYKAGLVIDQEQEESQQEDSDFN